MSKIDDESCLETESVLLTCIMVDKRDQDVARFHLFESFLTKDDTHIMPERSLSYPGFANKRKLKIFGSQCLVDADNILRFNKVVSTAIKLGV